MLAHLAKNAVAVLVVLSSCWGFGCDAPEPEPPGLRREQQGTSVPEEAVPARSPWRSARLGSYLLVSRLGRSGLSQIELTSRPFAAKAFFGPAVVELASSAGSVVALRGSGSERILDAFCADKSAPPTHLASDPFQMASVKYLLLSRDGSQVWLVGEQAALYGVDCSRSKIEPLGERIDVTDGAGRFTVLDRSLMYQLPQGDFVRLSWDGARLSRLEVTTKQLAELTRGSDEDSPPRSAPYPAVTPIVAGADDGALLMTDAGDVFMLPADGLPTHLRRLKSTSASTGMQLRVLGQPSASSLSVLAFAMGDLTIQPYVLCGGPADPPPIELERPVSDLYVAEEGTKIVVVHEASGGDVRDLSLERERGYTVVDVQGGSKIPDRSRLRVEHVSFVAARSEIWVGLIDPSGSEGALHVVDLATAQVSMVPGESSVVGLGAYQPSASGDVLSYVLRDSEDGSLAVFQDASTPPRELRQFDLNSRCSPVLVVDSGVQVQCGGAP